MELTKEMQEKLDRYDQLEQAVQKVYQENCELKTKINENLLLDKINTLARLIDRKELLSSEIIEKVEWHLNQMLAIPQND